MTCLAAVDMSNVRSFVLEFVCADEDIFSPLGRKFLVKDLSSDKTQENLKLIMKGAKETKIKPLLAGVLDNGYVMTNAVFKPLGQDNSPTCIMRFYFYQKEYAIVLPDFDEDTACRCIDQVCDESWWWVKVYEQPFIESGEAIPNVRSIVFNLSTRVHLTDRRYRPHGFSVIKRCYMDWSPDPREKEVRFMSA